MGTALDALANPSLNSRRPSAAPLPSFELPLPNFQVPAPGAKLPSHPSNPHPPTNPSVSSLLTPPASTQSSDGHVSTTAPTVAATTTTTTSVSASPDLTSSYASSYWQGQSAYGNPPPPAARQPWNPASYTARDTFSPSLNALNRTPATSSPGNDAISQSYEMNQLPPFQQSLSVSTASANQHHAMANAMLTAQNALPNPASAPPLPLNDPYMAKSSSTPAYTGIQPMSSPPGGYPPPYGQASMGMPAPGRVSSNPNPSTNPNPHPSHHHLSYQPRQPWPSYSLPAMNGPVMTNVHNPANGQMSLLGSLQPGMSPGFTSGHLASMQQMYGGHLPHGVHGGPGPSNDRPFKCDQCPQSFNRNHDLKRHKRIHLSVKPFPCTHCDKSFSRKDALKRHILVKGCGKDEANPKPERTVKEEEKEEVNGHG
ncbi:hypothetical protein EYZ11_011900 [Aspergillus tanneri]|uniref:C2H2-type domain-containing protein n=1 Tax=Aspergillus tanneri TaxID=1220188 RepID=A0A4S3J1X7_9EURO|nr:uncharacterized protein ATNIH1004_010252 [Aspergillus tanneri]KAA8643483.1 hypothetical protein ATNIH1004_010252 [Aspergillus tanneri]THC88655.1 hypothetical protein EYZ11_011900 [Aspergillus tanneri]